MSKTYIATLYPALLTLPFACRVYAQTFAETILGTVLDASVAAVPGATITVAAATTGVVRKMTSFEKGYYESPLPPPGEYSIAVEKTGIQEILAQRLFQSSHPGGSLHAAGRLDVRRSDAEERQPHRSIGVEAHFLNAYTLETRCISLRRRLRRTCSRARRSAQWGANASDRTGAVRRRADHV